MREPDKRDIGKMVKVKGILMDDGSVRREMAGSRIFVGTIEQYGKVFYCCYNDPFTHGGLMQRWESATVARSD